MASTYSDLKIELIGTGEQAGTWGATTNVNLGTAIEEAVVGSADVAFSSADVTLTLTDTNSTQAARHFRLNLTGTSGGARNLILGSGCQINKPYIVDNGLADTVTIKNTTGTGVAIPAGKSMFVFNNGVDVVETITNANITGIVTAGTGVTVVGNQVSIGQAVATSSDVQFDSFGVGTPASGITGEIRATDNVTAYYSSDRKFKENIRDIDSPLEKVLAIGGKYFDWTDAYIAEHGGEDGYFVSKSDFGVIAQDVHAVFPVAVKTREDGSLAVDYEKLCSLAFAAIQELERRIAVLENK
jgi:hypothetical protein